MGGALITRPRQLLVSEIAKTVLHKANINLKFYSIPKRKKKSFTEKKLTQLTDKLKMDAQILNHCPIGRIFQIDNLYTNQ